MDNKLSQVEQEALNQAQDLLELSKTKGWAQVLKPLLESKVHNSWVDPAKFTDDASLRYAYSIAWGWAKASGEVIDLVTQAETRVIELLKKERGEVIDKFRIGS